MNDFDETMQRMQECLESCRARFPSMTLGSLATFLTIARMEAEGARVTATDISIRISAPAPTIFRQCNMLADGVPGKPGMRLVEKVQKEEDGRSYELRLSDLGSEMLHEMAAYMEPELASGPSFR